VRRRLLVALALLALAARTAHATVEEFSTFGVATIESDDENFFDHWLTRVPTRWRDEFESTPNAFRTSQGCYTAGQWYMESDLKVRAPLGEHAWLDIGWQQMSDDMAQWEWLRLDFRMPTKHAGTFGIRFAPAPEKSSQDFSALWDWGTAAGPLQVGAVFTVEDAFNSLWEFRQAQVGNHTEPYHAHPLEPALRVVSRSRHHRVELSGKWLTPLGKNIVDASPAESGTFELWGAKGALLGEVSFGRWELETRLENEQVRSGQTTPVAPGDGHDYRRLWRAEGAARRRFGAHWVAEARGAYQDRAQNWRPPVADGAFRALDRGLAFEIAGEPRRLWHTRAGIMHDRIGVLRRGAVPYFSWGTRKEARAYVSLEKQFGRVHVQGIEGIELDVEPYEVTFHHDKGFLQLQTAF
jgi:hypothetical protein